jgi:hypothetical protein
VSSGRIRGREGDKKSEPAAGATGKGRDGDALHRRPASGMDLELGGPDISLIRRYRTAFSGGIAGGRRSAARPLVPKIRTRARTLLDDFALFLEECAGGPSASGPRSYWRNCFGVTPSTRLKCRVRWLWSENPTAAAISASERLPAPAVSSERALLTRTCTRY